MNAGQFGNYLAAYATVYNYRKWGYYGVRLAGDYYALGDPNFRWEDGTWLIDNEESIIYINKGAVAAFSDLLLGEKAQRNTCK
ncbi:MAG: hypothetical protein ABH952_12365 [Candidatus Omnitrophota bacterium]